MGLQLWEVMGRTIIEPNLIDKLLGAANTIIDDDDRKSEMGSKALFAMVNGPPPAGGLGYSLDRTEMSELSYLIKQPDYPVLTQRVALRSKAVGVRSTPAKVTLTLLGLLCIDKPLRASLSASRDVGSLRSALAQRNFNLPEEDLNSIFDLLNDNRGKQDYDDIHALWDPPDCDSALTWSPIFKSNPSGGVKKNPWRLGPDGHMPRLAAGAGAP